MNNIRKMGAVIGAGAVIFSLAGCGDKNGNGQAEAPMNPANVDGAIKDNLGDTANAVKSGAGAVANTVSGAAGAAGNAISNGAAAAGGAVTNGASKMGSAVESGASKMGGALANAGQAATMTPAVKTAIAGNAGLKGSKINVDTLGAKDSIALRGTVTSAGQMKLAESVAKKAAPGYKIINQLKMAGG